MSKSDAYSIHLEKAIDRIAGACSVLTRDDITQFIFNGYVLVKGAFSLQLAIAITDQAPETEEELPVTGGMHLYMITIAALLLALGTGALTASKLTLVNKNR